MTAATTAFLALVLAGYATFVIALASAALYVRLGSKAGPPTPEQ